MVRVAGIAVAVVLLLAGIGAVFLYGEVVSLETERVTDDVSVIFGAGGNVGVLGTEEGAVIVDTMTFAVQGRRIREMAERIAGGPTQVVVNTHYHTDHTHGNPAFAPGTRVVSTRRTRDYLMFFDAGYWDGAARATAPGSTFDDFQELRVGGKTIRLHHLGRGHTGGDLVVNFVEDRVVHTGDLFFHRRYPNIDLEAGGSVREWVGTIDRILEIDFDRVIPGHGAVTDRAGLREFQDFLRELWMKSSAAAERGMTLDETLRTVELGTDEGYEAISVPFVFEFDRDFVVRRAWEEASGAVTAVEVPPAES